MTPRRRRRTTWSRSATRIGSRRCPSPPSRRTITGPRRRSPSGHCSASGRPSRRRRTTTRRRPILRLRSLPLRRWSSRCSVASRRGRRARRARRCASAPPLPSSTETTLIGQREIRTDDGPVTSVAPDVSAAPAAPVPDRQAAPRLGAPLDPGLPVQRAPADPAPAALDDAVPADRSGDEVATVPATPGGPADRTPADGPAAPTSEAPLVGGDPIGPSTAPQRAVVEPSPSLSTAGVPHLAASAAPAVQRTVVDTPTSAAARPRRLAGDRTGGDRGQRDVDRHRRRGVRPDGGSRARPPRRRSSARASRSSSWSRPQQSLTRSPAGPVTASSDPATPGGIVTTAWADETTAAAVRPLDGGLLGDRPPTLTVDWADRAAPAGDTAPSPSGRAEAGAPSTPPVVSRTLADRTSRPSVATVAGVADATRHRAGDGTAGDLRCSSSDRRRRPPHPSCRSTPSPPTSARPATRRRRSSSPRACSASWRASRRPGRARRRPLPSRPSPSPPRRRAPRWPQRPAAPPRVAPTPRSWSWLASCTRNCNGAWLATCCSTASRAGYRTDIRF